MRILQHPPPVQENYYLPPQKWRDYNSLKATALDVGRSPALSKGWRGPLIVNGKLACHDDSPLARRYETVPVVEIEGPDDIDDWQQVGDVGDRVLGRIPTKTKPEAA